MRTTLNLDDRLITEAKKLAADTGRTLGEVVEDALRAALARRPPVKARVGVKLPTFKGRGLRPGVTLDDSAALAELMDGR